MSCENCMFLIVEDMNEICDKSECPYQREFRGDDENDRH